MTIQKITFSILLVFLIKSATAQISPFDSVNLLLQKRVYFDFGKYDITSETEKVLLEIQDSCIGKRGLFIHIEGHTDHVGTNENNLKLSRKRGETVKEFFVKNNFPSENISTSVFGESRPVADNTSDDGRQENRRAAISLYGKNKMAIIKGQVVDKDTGKGMKAHVVFSTKTHRDSMETDDDGIFEKEVVENTILKVDVFTEDYFFESQMMKAKKDQEVVMAIPLLPVKVGEKVAIKNLYFLGNQAVLQRKSRPELSKVLKFMQLNPKIKIEIAGHINGPRMTREQLGEFKWELATERAKVVYDYLIENKIKLERITYAGYGNSQMVYPNAVSEKDQALNRRVEIKILEARNK